MYSCQWGTYDVMTLAVRNLRLGQRFLVLTPTLSRFSGTMPYYKVDTTKK